MPKEKKTRNRKGYKPQKPSGSAPSGGANVPVNGPTGMASLYDAQQQLSRDAATLAFSQALGVPFEVKSQAIVNTNNTLTELQETIPGILRIGTTPTAGGWLTPVSAVNIAARNVYSWVRHANSGHSNYEAVDLMIYILAMAQIYRVYAWLKRVYGLAQTYSLRNRYIPRKLISMMGIDFEDLYANLADFRYRLNALGVRIGSLAVPNTFPYFIEAVDNISRVFTDSESAKAQLYFFDIDQVLKYDPYTASTGGRLEPMTWTLGGHVEYTVDAIFAKANSLIDPIVNDEDMNIMSGDIIKAYGVDNLVKISGVSEDYAVIPEYDPEVLSQIENMTVFDGVRNDSLTIYQENGALASKPKFESADPAPTIAKLISSRKDNPSELDVLVMTRFAAIAPAVSTSTTNSDYRKFVMEGHVLPTFIVTSLYVAHDTEQTGHAHQPLVFLYGPGLVNDLAPIGLGYTMFDLSQFDWAPIRPVWHCHTETRNYKLTSYFGDVDNYTVLSAEDLRKIHDTALLSLFNVTQVAR